MKLLIVSVHIFVITVCGENASNVDFNDLPKEKLLDAVCRSFCKKSQSAVCEENFSNFENCFCDEINVNLTGFKFKTNASMTPSLNCKEDILASFVWEAENDYAYFFQFSENLFSDVTVCNSYVLENLTEATNYKIRLWAVSYAKLEILHSDILKFKTSKSALKPEPVTNVSVQYLINANSYDAVVKWAPNKDFSCFYHIIYFDDDDDYAEEQVNVMDGPCEFPINSLRFETDYHVNIMAKSRSDEGSEMKNFGFTTPTCLTVYANLTKCPPESPRDLFINETAINITSLEDNFVCNIVLQWSKPDLLPDYYEAYFINHNGSQTPTILNISGDQTRAYFQNVEVGERYQISLRACSPAGCGTPYVEDRHRSDIKAIVISPNRLWSTLGLFTIILTILVLIVIAFLIIFINRHRTRQVRKEKRFKYFSDLEGKLPDNADTDLTTNPDSFDQWEISPMKLDFGDVLGEGAFGIVRKGSLEMKNKTRVEVAIKMLKDSPAAEEVRQFTQEIEIMKSVRQHPYIVSLIGCITRQLGGPLLVVEYCSRGDLQTYLRAAWEKLSNIQQDFIYIDDSMTSPNYFANRIYDFHQSNFEDGFIIQPKHLISIARQVALGMEHLARTRVVHRDLAARNVLVCENHTVKVSDFGLSRDVYQDNVYCKSGGGKLPIRWMALESLTHQMYTTQSDVWSFGILLWEIVTLGGTPYVGVDTRDLLELLRSGYRLKCPATCSGDLYSIMQNCWKASPKDRPTFSELCKSLEELLENVSQYLHLENIEEPSNIDMNKLNKSEELNKSPSSYELYIKPVSTFR